MLGSSLIRGSLVALCGLLVWSQASAQDLPRAASTEIPLPCGAGSLAPRLAARGPGVLLSWVEPSGAERRLKLAAIEGGVAGPAITVASGSDWFVNWADTPSVQFLPGGLGVAHWLQKSAQGTYDYDVRLATSSDGGQTWSPPFMANRDGVQAEHGFVSIYPAGGDRFGAVWLDGRFQKDAPEGRSPGMTLRWGLFDASGEAVADEEVDPRVCDCCPTDVALSSQGPVVVYRDRADDSEIRDVYVIRHVEGAWTEPRPVFADGWSMFGCPVNGPAVAAEGERVVVAWYTGAEGVPAVKVAPSRDGGANFSAPTRLDGGAPIGRVDVVLAANGDALISWLERVGDRAEIRVSRVTSSGKRVGTWSLATVEAARSSGVPHLARGGDALLVCWTDAEAGQVRLARVTEPGLCLATSQD